MRFALGLGLALALAGCGSSNEENASTKPDAGGTGGTGGGGSGGATTGGVGGVTAGGGGQAGTSASGGASANDRKRGIAYGHHSDQDLAALSAGIGWWYNWSPKPDATLSGDYTALGVEFVPMVWGGQFDANTLEQEVPKDAKYLLTFNEPNFGNQANLTPAEAAALWPEIEAFANSRGLKIVSPALNYCGSPCNDPDPFHWLTEFFAACGGCQVDYVAMHWYACDKPALENTLPKYEAFGKPLWVTEFSCLDDASKVNEADELSYMKDAVAVLEADPMVFRYSWFTGRWQDAPAIDLLGPGSGELTPLGAAYVSQPQ